MVSAYKYKPYFVEPICQLSVTLSTRQNNLSAVPKILYFGIPPCPNWSSPTPEKKAG